MKRKLCFLLLFVLVIPSFSFGYTIVRKDGRTFSGELIERTAQKVVVRDERGITVTFKTDQIDWKKTEAKSPEKKSQTKELKFQTLDLESKPSPVTKEWNGEVISVDFKDIDIKDFFRFIAEISGMNMILDPAVKGSLTLKLTEVPWDQALDVVCRTYGLGYQIEGNVMEVDKN